MALLGEDADTSALLGYDPTSAAPPDDFPVLDETTVAVDHGDFAGFAAEYP